MILLNEPVRKAMISADWTNNNCESINHVLKQAIDWKSKSLVELVSFLEDLVTGQHKELRSALLGSGEYRLADTHNSLRFRRRTGYQRPTHKEKKTVL